MKQIRNCVALAGIAAAMLWIGAAPAGAQVVGPAVRAATEQVFRQASKQGLEELAEMGGRAAVTEVLEQSAREGGDALVRRAAQYGIEDGPAALRTIGRSPAKMVGALDGLSPGWRKAGIAAVERNPELMTQLVKEYGSGAMEVAARHPGVGEKLAETLGEDGIQLGRKLTTDESIIAARQAGDIAKLPPAERSAVLGKIGAMPRAVLGFLETHPRTLTTAAGVAVVMAIKDDVIGDKGKSVVLADGRVVNTPGHAGLIERMFPSVSKAAHEPVMLISGVLAVGIAGWFAVHLLGKWRAQRR
ncbi:MAG TPA: hypothetical protein VIM11_09355 [Tepidisphaeraceae bacterium]